MLPLLLPNGAAFANNTEDEDEAEAEAEAFDLSGLVSLELLRLLTTEEALEKCALNLLESFTIVVSTPIRWFK